MIKILNRIGVKYGIEVKLIMVVEHITEKCRMDVNREFNLNRNLPFFFF